MTMHLDLELDPRFLSRFISHDNGGARVWLMSLPWMCNYQKDAELTMLLTVS